MAQHRLNNGKEHLMKCGDCGTWFDMRELNEVMKHEHWVGEIPTFTYSHVKKGGKRW